MVKQEDAQNYNEQEQEQDKIRFFFNSPGWLIISGMMTVIGLAFTVLGALEAIKNHKEVVVIIGFIVFVIGMFFVIKYAKNANKINTQLKNEHREQKKAIERLTLKMSEIDDYRNQLSLLMEKATNGMKLTHNYVTITITHKNSELLYCFNFEKHFKITSNLSPNSYKAQFYANKYPANREQAIEFYKKEENKIKWNDLQVKSYLQFKRSDGTRSEEKKLKVNNQIDAGNLIPFDIYFKTDGGAISLEKDMDVILKYSYQISSRLWGTYLNRTEGFFQAETSIRIRYDEKFEDLKCNFYNLNFSGYPVEYDKFKRTESLRNANLKEIKYNVTTEPFGKYRIIWDAKGCFGINEDNTENGIDELGVTNR